MVPNLQTKTEESEKRQRKVTENPMVGERGTFDHKPSEFISQALERGDLESRKWESSSLHLGYSQ